MLQSMLDDCKNLVLSNSFVTSWKIRTSLVIYKKYQQSVVVSEYLKKSPNLHFKINLGLANSNNKGNLIKIFFNSSYNVYVIWMAQRYLSIFLNLIGILCKVNFYTQMKFLNVLLVLIVCILWIYMVSVKRL